MKIDDIVRRIKMEIPTHYGRRLYAIVGSYEHLFAVEKAIECAGLPGVIPLNDRVLNTLGAERVVELSRFEARMGEAIRQELDEAYSGVLKECLSGDDMVIVKDFELLFQYGIDMNQARNLAIGGKAVIMLVPGRTDGQDIFAYGHGDDDGEQFFPSLFDPAHIWEVE